MAGRSPSLTCARSCRLAPVTPCSRPTCRWGTSSARSPGWFLAATRASSSRTALTGSLRWRHTAWHDSDTRTWPCSQRSEEHTSELQSQFHLVCRLLLEKKKQSEYPILNKKKKVKIHKQNTKCTTK